MSNEKENKENKEKKTENIGLLAFIAWKQCNKELNELKIQYNLVLNVLKNVTSGVNWIAEIERASRDSQLDTSAAAENEKAGCGCNSHREDAYCAHLLVEIAKEARKTRGGLKGMICQQCVNSTMHHDIGACYKCEVGENFEPKQDSPAPPDRCLECDMAFVGGVPWTSFSCPFCCADHVLAHGRWVLESDHENCDICHLEQDSPAPNALNLDGTGETPGIQTAPVIDTSTRVDDASSQDRAGHGKAGAPKCALLGPTGNCVVDDVACVGVCHQKLLFENENLKQENAALKAGVSALQDKIDAAIRFFMIHDVSYSLSSKARNLQYISEEAEKLLNVLEQPTSDEGAPEIENARLREKLDAAIRLDFDYTGPRHVKKMVCSNCGKPGSNTPGPCPHCGDNVSGEQ